MSVSNQISRFAELEVLMEKYFHQHIAPVMKETRTYLVQKQGEEMLEYSTSAAGILSSMASAHMPMSTPYDTLKVTGEWNSKTTEDYVAMCRERIVESDKIQHDLNFMADEWRNAVIKEVGLERYNELSEAIGTDLANAFIENRFEEKMIDKLVKERMPQSSSEYIIRKAAESSIFGLNQVLNKSPLDHEIDKRGEAAYNPSNLEKGAGYTIGAVADAVSMGGAGSWTSLAKFVGLDLAITAVANGKNGETETVSVEECISKGVFNSDKNVFDGFREEASRLTIHESEYIADTNKLLSNPIYIPDYSFNNWINPQQHIWKWESNSKPQEERANVPLVIAPGHEKAYLESLQEKKKNEQAEIIEEEEPSPTVSKEEVKNDEQSVELADENVSTPQQTNSNGWSGLLSTVGLDNFKDVSHNLGYVFAMLPDMIVGLFTGKTKSLNLSNSLLPVASILAGMFVRNPLLKTLLIGLGGMNLVNKVGHESLHNKQNEGWDNPNVRDANQVQYRKYEDEPLNSRISGPVLQGHSLIATIDNVPCTIQLPNSVVDAHKSGALPLNTLANAVLVKSDQMQRLASQNYEQEQRETITRVRGIQ